MKYREEVMSKIFTYITVILLLSLVAFEAYMIQKERNNRDLAQAEALQLENDLVIAREINYDLQVENSTLKLFQEEWEDYAAFSDSSVLESCRKDLLSRDELIPQQAIVAFVSLQDMQLSEQNKSEETAESEDAEEENTQKTANKDTASQKEDSSVQEENAADEEPLIELPVFAFHKLQQEEIFLALADPTGNNSCCLVYTTAYEEEGDAQIELLYELPYSTNKKSVCFDEHGDIVWNCIAYNIGDGWTAVQPTENEETIEGENT